MKSVQELRTGNVILVDNQPYIIIKAEHSNQGLKASVKKMKLKNLLSGSPMEAVYKTDEKFEQIILDRRVCNFSYFADPNYVFMDEDYNQYEIDKENLGESVNYIVDGMEDSCEVVFYDDKPISVELPTTIVREITYTEPVVRGDTSGKVMKDAKLANNFQIQVPAFINIGDKIEIDTRNGEFKKRASAE